MTTQLMKTDEYFEPSDDFNLLSPSSMDNLSDDINEQQMLHLFTQFVDPTSYSDELTITNHRQYEPNHLLSPTYTYTTLKDQCSIDEDGDVQKNTCDPQVQTKETIKDGLDLNTWENPFLTPDSSLQYDTDQTYSPLNEIVPSKIINSDSYDSDTNGYFTSIIHNDYLLSIQTLAETLTEALSDALGETSSEPLYKTLSIETLIPIFRDQSASTTAKIEDKKNSCCSSHSNRKKEIRFPIIDHTEKFKKKITDGKSKSKDLEDFSRKSRAIRLKENKTIWRKVIQTKKKGIYKCTHCSDIFSDLYKFALHLDAYEVIRPCKCPFEDCAWHILGLPRRAEVRRHCASQHEYRLEFVHSSKFNNNDQPEIDSNYTNIFHCGHDLCEKVFKRKDSQKRHIQLVHLNPKSRFNRRIITLKKKYKTDDIEEIKDILAKKKEKKEYKDSLKLKSTFNMTDNKDDADDYDDDKETDYDEKIVDDKEIADEKEIDDDKVIDLKLK